MTTYPFDDEFSDNEAVLLSEINSEEDFFWEKERLVKDFAKAIRLNSFYSKQLGWETVHEQINEILLKVMGLAGMSLNEGLFVQAVVGWQRMNGFEEKDCDGIIGPATWKVMQQFIRKSTDVPKPSTPTDSDQAPPVYAVYEFNSWYATRIIQSMNDGIIGNNFNSKLLLEQIVRGEKVKKVDPHNDIIQVLPIIHHISACARKENYRDIVIGSFIRDPKPDGSCTGHCRGRCIDINHRYMTFDSEDALVMVRKIFSYLLSLPVQYRKNFGFGLPLQGRFFGAASLPKFKKASADHLRDAELRELVKKLGIVFPDNPNHLHIQVDWMK